MQIRHRATQNKTLLGSVTRDVRDLNEDTPETQAWELQWRTDHEMTEN